MNLHEFIACLACMLGYLMVLRDDRRGLWLGLMGSVLFLVFFLMQGMVPTAMLQLGYAAMNLHALFTKASPDLETH